MRSERRSGQSLVEFALGFTLFVGILFTLLEITKLVNTVVALDTVAAHGARTGAARLPGNPLTKEGVLATIRAEAKRHPFVDEAKLEVELDLEVPLGEERFRRAGDLRAGLATRVRLHYSSPIILLPAPAAIPLSVTTLRLNDDQRGTAVIP